MSPIESIYISVFQPGGARLKLLGGRGMIRVQQRIIKAIPYKLLVEKKQCQPSHKFSFFPSVQQLKKSIITELHSGLILFIFYQTNEE